MLKRRWQAEDVAFFMHIPKTAGTTFHRILTSRYAKELTRQGRWRNFDKIKAEDLSPYRLVTGHFPYALVNYLAQPPLVLTFLREPVARMISEIDQAQREDEHQLQNKHDHFADIPILELLTDKKFVRRFGNKQVRFLSKDSLHDTKVTPDDLALAKERLTELAFFGLTERFDDSLKLLSHTFDFGPIVDFETRNVSPRRTDRLAGLSQENLDVLAEVNRFDLELYEFGKALFAERLQTMEAEISTGACAPWTESLRTTQIDHDLSVVDIGAQWHSAWRQNDGSYLRWTGPGSSSHLTLPPLMAGKDYLLTFYVNRAISNRVLDSLRVMVNEQPVELAYKDQKTLPSRMLYGLRQMPHSRLYSGVLPAQIFTSALPVTRLTLTVNGEYMQADQTVTDPARAQGICLNWVKIEPVAPVPQS
jgi:hypothetical protein